MRKKLAILFGVLFIAATTVSCVDKVKVCHKGKWIEVSVHAVQGHLQHGDKIIIPVF